MVTINGEQEEAVGQYLGEYLIARGYRLDTIAVECNGEIVARERLSEICLADGDTVEIVRFVGGG